MGSGTTEELGTEGVDWWPVEPNSAQVPPLAKNSAPAFSTQSVIDKDSRTQIIGHGVTDLTDKNE
ncbi:hypothetical protein, partial [Rathayibacter rathayi]|uniref:hypothetical protein n=1 Tax=Rathayibacter rathayi TaxID=33887 RepID=UPI001F3BAD93